MPLKWKTKTKPNFLFSPLRHQAPIEMFEMYCNGHLAKDKDLRWDRFSVEFSAINYFHLFIIDDFLEISKEIK